MRIAFIVDSINPNCGGVERVTDNLCKQLYESKKFKITLISFDKELLRNKPIYIDNVLILNAQQKKRIFKNTIEINKLILANNIQYLINQKAENINTSILLILLRTINRKIRIISCLHRDPENYRKNLNRKDFLSTKSRIINSVRKITNIFIPWDTIKLRLSYVFSYHYILLSDSFIDKFKKITHLKVASKILVIPNPLTFENSIKHGEIVQKNKTVLIVSRLIESEKRILLALKIWNHHFFKNKDWKLVIIGDGPDLSLYIEFANKEGIRNIEFLGKQNPLEYYKKASIFMMTSRSEGFGMTLTESLQYGVVPIVFDTFSSLNDIVTNNVNGLIIEELDINEFRYKMHALMNNKDMRIEMANNGVKSIYKFRNEIINEKWYTIFQK